MLFPDRSSESLQRYHVRGRVLVFTTSQVVEFLEDGQKFSYPLYSHSGSYPAGCGLTFTVEVSGYLTFDVGAQVKLVELEPYQRFDFDPSRFVVVAPAGFLPLFDSVNCLGHTLRIGYLVDGHAYYVTWFYPPALDIADGLDMLIDTPQGSPFAPFDPLPPFSLRSF